MVRLAALLLSIGLAFSAALACSEPSFPRIHRVAGGQTEVFANAYIIEGAHGVLVVDALLTRAGSEMLRKRVAGLGKPLLAVLLTHGHPDHYGGVAGLLESSPGIPVIATKGADLVIRRDDPSKGRALAALSIDWAPVRKFPSVAVEDGVRLALADLEVTVVDVGEGESDSDSIWLLRSPEGPHAFVGDQVMSGAHAYIADAHTKAWLGSLRTLRSKLGTARIYPGHGEPGGPELVQQQVAYLEQLRKEVRAVTGGAGSITEQQILEVEHRMVEFLGHDRMSRWIREGARPVAAELAGEPGKREDSKETE